MESLEFSQSMKGSLASNVITCIILLVVFVVRQKLKHSKCHSNCLCCEMDVSDTETEPDP